MVYVSKRKKEFEKVADRNKVVSLDEAMAAIDKFPKVKFDETVELHFHLNIDLKATEQSVRGTVVLPHGTGKTVRIAVFCKGEQAQKARDLGVECVGGDDLIDKVSKGFMDFDCVVATPDMMKDLSKLGRVLGPRGLMPSPKAGTVTMDVAKAIQDVRAGKVEFKSDKQGGIHVGIGKRSFAKDKLVANAQHLIEAIDHAKPAAVKGSFIKSLFVATSMGPSARVVTA